MNGLIQILAIVIAAFGGHYIAFPLAEWTRKKAGIRKSESAKWMTGLLGILERGMCVAAWFLGYPQFIGIWLSIKTVGSWGRWRDEAEGRFSNFLFLTALSISIAVAMAIITEWILTKV